MTPGFESFAGDIIPGSTEELGNALVRSRVLVSAELRDGGTLEASLIAIARMRDGRMAYGWGTYDPEAAERKLAELQAGQETADA